MCICLQKSFAGAKVVKNSEIHKKIYKNRKKMCIFAGEGKKSRLQDGGTAKKSVVGRERHRHRR